MTAQPAPSQSPSPELIAQIQQGLAYQQAKEMDKAQAIFDKVVAENPDNPEVLQIAAIFYDQVENYKKVRELLEHLIISRPKDASINKLLGKALTHAKEYGRAHPMLEFAITYNMDDPEAWYYLAECELRENRFRNAEGYFVKSLEKKSTVKTHNKLIVALLLQNQNRIAAEMLSNFIEKDALNYESLILLAIAQGPASVAGKQTLEKALAYSPDRKEAHDLLKMTQMDQAEIAEFMEKLLPGP